MRVLVLLAVLLCGWPARAAEPEIEAEAAPSPVPPVAEEAAPAPAATLSETDAAAVDEARNAAVVTASGGSEESQAEASANVATVGWEEIARRHYRSLAEILADVPGLYVVDDLVSPAVSVRGVSGGLRAGTRVVKVMINGVPVSFRPDLTAFLGPEYIPVEMIERVEVAKGPLSALYGANAFVATVNVITRGQGGAQLVAEVTARAQARGGGVGYGGTLVGGFNEGSQSLFVAVTGERLDRSGLSVARTFGEQSPDIARYRPFFGSSSAGDVAAPRGLFAQHVTRLPWLGTLTLQGGVQQLDSMGEFQLNSVLTHQSRFSVENDWLSLRHEKAWTPEVSTAVWFGWSRGLPTRDESLRLTGSNDAVFQRRFSYQAFDAAAELSASVGPVRLKGGFDFSYEPQRVLYYSQTFLDSQGTGRAGTTVDLVGAGDQRQLTLHNEAVYLQAGLEPLKDLSVTGNFRLDVPSLFAVQYSWRLAVVRRWSRAFTTKLVGGRAFQSPSATLLNGLTGFGSANNVIGSRTQPSSRPLVPQTVHSVELVNSLQLFGRLALELSLWGQQIDDPIEFVQVGANFQARNQAVQRGFGAEASVRLEVGAVSARLFGEGMLAVVDGYVQTNPPPSYPAYRVGAELNAAVPKAYLGGNVRLAQIGPRGATQSNAYLNDDTPYSLPGYTSLDVSVSTLGLRFLGGAQTALAISCKNLLDERHSEPGFGGLDVPTLGRLFAFELKGAY
ncbi:MAG TPA: TonB-dependent receptor plug domain-containing protein [Myxococcales bacterium]|jgi:iron complex outermembrane receptor protein